MKKIKPCARAAAPLRATSRTASPSAPGPQHASSQRRTWYRVLHNIVGDHDERSRNGRNGALQCRTWAEPGPGCGRRGFV
eukprot:2193620-Rhodomonas_salina.1